MKRIAFDLDGTLCTEHGGDYKAAQPIPERVAQVRALYDAGHHIIIDSGRGSGTGDDWYPFTVTQLAAWNVPYHRLYTGRKPHADHYIDATAVSADDFFAAESGHAERWPDEYFAQRAGNDRRRLASFAAERAFLAWHGVWGSGAVCDIGCSTGEFLDAIEWRGPRYGMEISAHAQRIAESRGISFERNIFTERAFFDVVIFRGTIQHIPTPFKYIERAHRALKPGGHIAFLATPNTGSLYYRMFEEFPLPLSDDSRNFWMPSARTLSNALRNFGFEIVAVEYPYWGGPYARPVHDVVSFSRRLVFGRKVQCSWPKNLLNLLARKS